MKMNHTETIGKMPVAKLSERTRELLSSAKELEAAGKFEEARTLLSPFWQRIGDRPKVDGLEEPIRAELLLRVGTLSGWIGSASQIPGAQEIAKDLISESSAIFARLGQTEKVAEAGVDLGICYWRAGALEEARITFDDAIQRLGNLESEQRLRAILNKAIVEQVSARSKEALQMLSDAEPLFEKSSNHALRGKFHNEYATVLKNVGLAERREDYIDRSLMQFTAATLNLELAGHDRFLSVVENNISSVFAHLERFEEAHEHLDRALAIVAMLDDKGQRAQFEDTRARVYLRQGNFDQAETIARSAVKGFRAGDEQSNLAFALTTHATALARLARSSEAMASLNEAVEVARQAGDPETGGLASLTAIEELSSFLSPAELRTHYRSAKAALAHSQHPGTNFRLGECARLVLDTEENNAAAATPEPDPSKASLEEQVLSYEGELIKRALQASDGSVTRAARLLGVTHQGLAFILNGRQKNLLPSRKPAKPRRRSIIRFH
ncbi:MAG: MalT-like region [Pyrinomonadaceae bacterium]|jgi:tetratricopeptide (TPR) repeat protein|nr:MalT-like region [Pyrinomonadaceae bacterium]